VGIAAFNLLFSFSNVVSMGGYLGPLAADAFNHHLPLLAGVTARVDAIVLAGLIALVGSGVALAPLGRRTRGWVIVGVMANLVAMLAVLVAFALGLDLGE
jgi:hypothetical protein